jgi:hypothetical protein
MRNEKRVITVGSKIHLVGRVHARRRKQVDQLTTHKVPPVRNSFCQDQFAFGDEALLSFSNCGGAGGEAPAGARGYLSPGEDALPGGQGILASSFLPQASRRLAKGIMSGFHFPTIDISVIARYADVSYTVECPTV